VSAGGIGQAGSEDADMPDAGAAQDTERAAALERRYRRLLRCYPPSHREVHREEMLGVLLAAARAGQRAPGVAQTVNLVACGLAIRARRALSGLADEPWQDALAVVSLIAPVLMIVIAALDSVEAVRVAVTQAAGPRVPVVQLFSFVPSLGGPAAVSVGWLAVVLLGLAGRRRTAAAIASVLLALAVVNLLVQVVDLSGAWSGGLPLFVFTAGLVAPVVMASLAACSLALSAGPRRGLAIVGRRQAGLMIAGLSGGLGFPVIAALLSPSSRLAAPAFGFLGVLAIAAAIVATRVRSTAGWRVAVLVALGLLLNLASTVRFAGGLTATVVILLASLLFAVLVWLVAIASWKGRGRRASRAAAR
jgi:hypothetical protein